MTYNGKSRSGWLYNPAENDVASTIVVDERPVVLRYEGLVAPIQILQRLEPLGVATFTPIWGPLVVEGVAIVLEPAETLLVLSLPGVYKLASLPSSGVVSYEEDIRKIEWNALKTRYSLGKSRSGFLTQPRNNPKTFVVQEQPVILRAVGLVADVVIQHRIDPHVGTTNVYTWNTFIVNGKVQVMNSANTVRIIDVPGVYRLVNMPRVGDISFEEDRRTSEWGGLGAPYFESSNPGSGTGSGVCNHAHTQYLGIGVAFDGQVQYVTGATPKATDLTDSELYINGVRYYFGVDFLLALSGQLNWSGPFDLEVDDEVSLAFISQCTN